LGIWLRLVDASQSRQDDSGTPEGGRPQAGYSRRPETLLRHPGASLPGQRPKEAGGLEPACCAAHEARRQRARRRGAMFSRPKRGPRKSLISLRWCSAPSH